MRAKLYWLGLILCLAGCAPSAKPQTHSAAKTVVPVQREDFWTRVGNTNLHLIHSGFDLWTTDVNSVVFGEFSIYGVVKFDCVRFENRPHIATPTSK